MTIVDQDIIERRVSVDIDIAKVRRMLGFGQLLNPSKVYVPLSILPKGLIFDFDVRNAQGHAVPLANRSTDSKVAAKLLARAAGVRPPRPMQDLLYAIAHAFIPLEPGVDDIESAAIRFVSARLENELDELSGQWWRTALDVPAFREAIGLYTYGFLALVNIDLVQANELIKYRRVEERLSVPARFLVTERSPSEQLYVQALDMGRAQSEHFRVIAPPRTILTDAQLHRSKVGSTHYSVRTAKDRTLLYTSELTGPSCMHHFLGVLWPEPEGFAKPSKFLTLYATLVLLAGGVIELLSRIWPHTIPPLVSDLSEHSEASVTLLLALPTLMIAYILRDNEHVTRSKLLKPWREWTLWSLAPLWVASVSVLIPRCYLLSNTLWSIWISLGLAALYIYRKVRHQRLFLEDVLILSETESHETNTYDIYKTAYTDSEIS